jgi:hypothetical protein
VRVDFLAFAGEGFLQLQGVALDALAVAFFFWAAAEATVTHKARPTSAASAAFDIAFIICSIFRRIRVGRVMRLSGLNSYRLFA